MIAALTPILFWLYATQLIAGPVAQAEESGEAPWNYRDMRDEIAEEAKNTKLCDYYPIGSAKSHEQINICSAHCKEVDKEDDGGFIAGFASCLDIGDPGRKLYDDDGEEYTQGFCECQNEIAEAFGEVVFEGLTHLDEWLAKMISDIGCQIFFDALNVVLEVATTFIPGAAPVKAVGKGVQVAVRAARGVEEVGGTAMDFIGLLPTNSICQTDNDYPAIGVDLFDILRGKKKPGSKPDGPPKKSDKPKDEDKPKDTPSDKPKSDKPVDKTTTPVDATSKATDITKTSSKAISTESKPSKASGTFSTVLNTASESVTPRPRSSTLSTRSSTTKSDSLSISATKSSSTSSAPACALQTGKPRGRKRQQRKPVDDYAYCANPKNPKGEPSQDNPQKKKELAKIIELLKNYDKKGEESREEAAKYIVERYMTNEYPARDLAVFYIGGASDQAQFLKETQFKETIESVYYDYNEGCFNPKLQPRKEINRIHQDQLKKNPLANNELEHTWWRATSRALARQVSGDVYVIYDDNNLFSATGRNGDHSIFVTDEFPEMAKNPLVKRIFQIKTACAELWNPGTVDDLFLLDFDIDVGSWPVCDIKQSTKKVPARLVYERDAQAKVRARDEVEGSFNGTVMDVPMVLAAA